MSVKLGRYVFRRIRGRIVRIRVDKSARQVGDQLTRIAQKSKERVLRKLDSLVKTEFGFTTNPKEAGFIDRKGRLLDLSGKNQGGSPGFRVRDHREVEAIFKGSAEDRTSNMFEFMKKTRSVRVSDHGSVFNADMVIKPNAKQETMLRAITKKSKVIYGDRTTVKATTLKSGEYRTATEMLNDLFRKTKKK